MQTIGFNFTKISAERFPTAGNIAPSMKIEFTNVEKENLSLLKENEAIKVSFNFLISYEPPQKKDEEKSKKKTKSSEKLAEISFCGSIVFSCSDEESKEFQKSWKNKQVPKQYAVPIYNFLLRKCSTKALSLEEDLNLPPHVQLPQFTPAQNQNQ